MLNKKTTHGTCLKILTYKEMLRKLPIELAQIQTGNTAEKLIEKIRQTIYFLYRAKETNKTVNNYIMISIQL